MGTTPDDPQTAALAPGETVLWRGRPFAGRRWGVTQIVGGGLGAFALVGALPNLMRGGEDPFALLPALIGCGFGAACLYVAFVREPNRRRLTRYALTDRRGFVSRPGLISGQQATWREIGAETWLDLVDHGDGLGTIWFHRRAWRPHGERHEKTEVTGFEFISDAPEVHAMIAAIQARLRAETGPETPDA